MTRAGASIPDSNYFSTVEKKLSEGKMRSRLEELEGSSSSSGSVSMSSSSASVTAGSNMSFKDVVTSFAMTSGITFVPKQGRQFEGKQIWQFGKCSCYLEHDVVFLYDVSKQHWRPVGLEEMLRIAS